MDEYTNNAIVNRNEPIPVISPPDGDSVDSSKSHARHQHKRSGSASGRSIQDRLFTKYAGTAFYFLWFPCFHVANRMKPQVLAADVSRRGKGRQ